MTWALAIPGMISAISGMAGQGSETEEAKRKSDEARQVAEGLGGLFLPKEDYSYINYAGDYSPYSLGTPQAAQYQTINENPETRNIEMQALQQLVAQANGSADAQGAADRFHALNDAAQMAQAREGAIRQQMERRGQGGAGLNAVMQAQAAQDAANRAQGGTLDAVSKAALQKLSAMQGAIGAAGQVRGQDFNTQRYNTDTINDFNKLNTGLQNAWHAQDISNQNAAQLRNIGTRQDIVGRNAGITNAGVDKRYQAAKDKYNADVQRTGMITNAINGQGNTAMQAGGVYNSLGQQGAQLFNNIGAGATAAMNANRGGGFTPTPERDPDYESEDGSFKSWYE